MDYFHTLVVGMTQSGKTIFTMRYLLNVVCACRFIFDDLPGQKSFAHKLGVRPCYTLLEVLTALPTRWVVFNPSRMFPDDYAAAFDWFCKFVFDCASAPGNQKGLKILVVDELWQWANERAMPKNLRLCTQAGAEYGVQLFTATQEPHRVNSSIVGQCRELVCFRLQEPKSWKCVSDLGADAQKIASLPIGQFLAYNRLSGGQLSGNLFE